MEKQTLRELFCKLLSVLSVLIFLASGIGTFVFFNDSLWLLVNIIVSFTIAFGLGFGFFALFQPGLPEVEGAPNSEIAGIFLIIIAAVIFGGVKSCYYTSPEEKAEMLAAIEEKEKAAELERRERAIAAEKLEKEESADFLASGENMKIYGAAPEDYLFLTKAKFLLRKYAHDPDSLKDVQILGPALRVRVKEYPNCRYAAKVSFRAKNAFGAVVRNEGVIFYDRGINPIVFLPDSNL